MRNRNLYRAFAKINLGLDVLHKRPDGFHEIRTVLQSIDLGDRLEFHSGDELSLRCSDPDLPSGEDNLVIRAARALQKTYECSKGARIVLTKKIPSQAGLGGGSSDAATTLVALSRLWSLPADPVDLCGVAAELGSDVPFFLTGGTAFGVAKGEEIYPLPDGPTLHLVLSQPATGTPTDTAYERISHRLTGEGVSPRMGALVHAIVEGKFSERHFFNCFEEVNEGEGGESREVKDALYALGADKVLLAGSGSAWVGMFRGHTQAVQARRGMAARGFNAIRAATITRKDYWEQGFPSQEQELRP
jgi:4-diphosphocytidyl-2-C-methyl-D-erythritol kinase